MKKVENISSLARIAVVLLSLTFLAPDTAKFLHIFSHEKHTVCEGGSTVHFHAVDIDCEFYKFKVQNQFLWNLAAFEPLVQPLYIPYYNTYNSSIYKVTITYKSLRAPPVYA